MIGALSAFIPAMVHPTQQRPPFPNRTPLPTIIFARNGKVRSFKVRLWVAGPLLGFLGLFLAAYTGATLYLIYRDDLLGTTLARQVAMQYAYEDRIAALRAELDRVTSRHVVATAGVEQQLEILLERQATIEQRQSTLHGLVERARDTGIEIAADTIRTPRARPDIAAAQGSPSMEFLAYAPTQPPGHDIIADTLVLQAEADEAADREVRLRPILAGVQSSLDDMQTDQSDALDALSAATEGEAERLSTAVAPLGIAIDESDEEGPRGGPYVPATGLHFVERAAVLNQSLERIAALRRAAEAMPLLAPVEGRRISSGFGYRIDPFLQRPALHAGIDFAAGAGTEVRATAAGTIVSAGWQGGYGQMVEIRHANGMSTRYGHLSRTLVSAGEQVLAGAPIGTVGATGRATGPHLHYETRRDGTPVDPALFIAAGRAL
jgi:murein DD-endopeptidase MepM/ murein hydrolase activator NlpD